MNPLKECIEREASPGKNRYLTIEHEVPRLQRGDGLHNLWKIARQRLLGFGLELDVCAIAESNAAKSVPLRFILPLFPLRNCIY